MVYCGYLDDANGRDMVAIKTCKGKNFISVIVTCVKKIILALSAASDKKKLLKEVTTMHSFKHPNVMSLIGVCFDGETPMILMPYMSNGSVLEYVKRNKVTLFFEIEVNKDEVYMYFLTCQSLHALGK